MPQLPTFKAAAAMTDTRKSRTWAEISLANIARNVRVLSESIPPNAEYLAVVKADAYGHGAGIVARECERQGVRHFGVATIEEAMALRRAGIAADIYIFSPFLLDEANAIVRADLIPFVSSLSQTQALTAATGKATSSARCFLTLDSGMGREGCLPDEALAIWDCAANSPLRITGIATHLSRADEPGIGDVVSRAQSDAFLAFVRQLGERCDLRNVEDGQGNRGIYLSIANSPATLRLPHGPLTVGVRAYLMRGGLLTYGIEPYRGAYDGIDLLPTLAWRARVTLIRDFAAGTTIGYGQSYIVERPSRIATLAVGYADGLSRRLSNCGLVLIRGKRCPIVGRVSMDQCQVDVTEIAGLVQLGDAVTLIGRDGDDEITVLDMAEQIGTTPHEPTCALSARVPRIYV